jgi:hypothetical protein
MRVLHEMEFGRVVYILVERVDDDVLVVVVVVVGDGGDDLDAGSPCYPYWNHLTDYETYHCHHPQMSSGMRSDDYDDETWA